MRDRRGVERRRLVLVNRFGASAPTGAAAAKVARHLRSLLPAWDVLLITEPGDWRPAGSRPLVRLIDAIIRSLWLARRSWSSADVVIALTDPPFLPLAVGLLRPEGRRWAVWTMDIFPELFAACELMPATHPLYRLHEWLDRCVAPGLQIVLSVGQRAVVTNRRSGRPTPSLILPVGLEDETPGRAMPKPGAASDEPLELIYAGTLGLVHEPAPLIRLVERSRGRRIRFLLAPRGGQSRDLRRALAGAPQVSWHERLSAGQLARASAHLVSLSSKAADLSVPSKAMTAISLGCPVIWLGPADATWELVREAGWQLPPEDHADDAAINRILDAVSDPVERKRKGEAARHIADKLRRTWDANIAALAAWIESGGLGIEAGMTAANAESDAD